MREIVRAPEGRRYILCLLASLARSTVMEPGLQRIVEDRHVWFYMWDDLIC